MWGCGGELSNRNLIDVSYGQLRNNSGRLINSCRQETLCCGYVCVLKCLLRCPKEVHKRGGSVALQNITTSL
jgi:hypothetical protein